MTPQLPDIFLRVPIAHRALHDRAAGRPENSRAAIRAAVAAGYGIEIDVQLSADGEAMVFHDEELGRLTTERGPVRDRPAAGLQAIPLLDGDGDGIPTLAQVLDIVAGQVPLLIEVKDQDGALGMDVGLLEKAVARALAGYRGPVAVMSFNPESVAQMWGFAPDVPRGITTSPFRAGDWPHLTDETRETLRAIPDFERVGASFISHQADDLDSAAVARLKAGGVPVLCWTIRSEAEEHAARQVADNVTFEGYAAAITAA